MAGRTTNYGWTKPEANDYVEASVLAEVFEAVDGKVKEVENHGAKKDNPHGVTKTQVGLGNVPNVATNDQTPTYTAAGTLTGLTSGEKLSVAFGKIAKAVADLISHLANKNNPHGVTASQAGAVAKTGDTMTGNLNGTNVYLSGALGVGGKKSTTDAATGIVFGKTGNITMQGDSAPAMNFLVGGGTAAKGRVAVDTSNTRLDSYQTAGSNTGMRGLKISHAGTAELVSAISLVVNESTYYNLFGTHNKQTGTYTGNGSTASRTVSIGATANGKVLFVGSSAGVALVTQTGAICLSSGTITALKYANSNFGGNVSALALATDNICLNKSGTTYTYAVL